MAFELIPPEYIKFAKENLLWEEGVANKVWNRAEVALQNWGVFSLNIPDRLLSAAIVEGFQFAYTTPLIAQANALLMIERFRPSEVVYPEDLAPLTIPQSFIDSFRIENQQLWGHYIVQHMVKQAIADRLILDITNEEYLYRLYGQTLRAVLHSEESIFNAISRLRARWRPPTSEADPHLSPSQLSKVVTFLMTPYEHAKKLPKNVLDDISTYFDKASKPNFEITLPGWNEIVKIFPDVQILPGEKVAWTAWRKSAKQAGFGHMAFDLSKINAASIVIGSPPLNFQQIEKMRKRWEIAKRINMSPTPDTLQTVGNILTWFDDIQDALVTLSYLGRVGITVLKHVVPRVALKAVPVLGWVSAAKDMMDVFHYIRALRIARSEKKRNFWDSLELLPRSRLKSLKHFGKIKHLLPSWQESIQIAQTTEAVFGTGLALGPIVGAVEDIFFGLFTGGTFHFLGKELPIPTLFDHPKIFQQVGIFSPNMTPASLQAFRIINKASRVLPHLNHLPVDVVLNVFTALHYAWCYLAASGDLRDWEDWQKKTVNLEIKTQPLEWHTKEILSELPFYPVRDSEPFGSPTHTSVTTPMHLANGIRKTFIDELNVFMEAHKNEELCKYICSLINEITSNYLIALNGPGSEIKETLAPFPSAIMLIFHYDLDEKLPPDQDNQIALVSDLADLIIHNFGKWPSLARVQDIFRKYPL